MPRLNNDLPPKTREKFNNISLRQNDDYWDGVVYVYQPLTGSETGGSDDYVTGLQAQNFLNTTIREGTTTTINIPIKPADKISTDNGTIRYKIIGGSRAPLSTQTKGENTIEWMQNNRNIKIELEVSLPDKDITYYFYFEDPSKNQVPIVVGESAQKVSARTYYKTNESPKVDHLSDDKAVVGQYVELTGALEAWLQNDKGSSLFINYTTAPVKPKNAKYMVLDIASMPLVNSIEITGNGSPLNFTMIDKLNADLLADGREEFTSDDWYIDLADPRTSLDGNSKKPLWRSTMSGEIHNKLRIWNEFFTGQNSAGDFNVYYSEATITNDEGKITNEFLNSIGLGWDNLIPNTEYVIGTPPGLSANFSNQILDCYRGGNSGDAPTPWYNEFSFFENMYSTKNLPSEVGNPAWKTSNAFFIFDVEKANTNPINFRESIVQLNPNKSLLNPNFTEEDYYKLTRQALTGTVNINGTTFNGWVSTLESTPKDDKLYNWSNDAENRKYIVLTPKLEYTQRYKKILENGGQFSKDNNVNVKVGSAQSTSARHPFPTGDGSVDIHYDSNIWYDEAYAAGQGWPTSNKIVVAFDNETEIDKVLLNIWAGTKYRISFYDSKFKPAIGINASGTEEVLSPTIIAAGNKDISNDPLKSSVEIIYGISSRHIL